MKNVSRGHGGSPFLSLNRLVAVLEVMFPDRGLHQAADRRQTKNTVLLAKRLCERLWRLYDGRISSDYETELS